MSTMQTERTTVHRLPERGRYDAATVHAILDEALICHVGFVIEGEPVVIPTIHWRIGDTLYFHGSPAAGFLRSLRSGLHDVVLENGRVFQADLREDPEERDRD